MLSGGARRGKMTTKNDGNQMIGHGHDSLQLLLIPSRAVQRPLSHVGVRKRRLVLCAAYPVAPGYTP